MKTTESVSDKKITLKISAKDFLIALICFALSKAKLLTYMNPFGLAFYAATFSPTGWYYSFIASIIGIISSKGDFTAFRYILALGIATPIIGLSDKRKTTFKALIMSLSYFVVCTLLMISGGFLLYDYIYIAFESFICFTSIYVLSDVIEVITNYKSKKTFSNSERVSVIATISLLILATASAPDIFGLKPYSLIAIFIILCVNLKQTCMVGATAGVIMGMVISMTYYESVSIIGAYTFCSFMAGLLKRYSRLGVLLGFTLGNAIITAFLNDTFYLLINPIEVITAGLVFATLPKKTLSFFLDLTDKVTNTANEAYSDEPLYDNGRIDNMSRHLSSLSDIYSRDCVHRVLGKQYINHLFNMCVDRVCTNCGLKFACWQSATYRNYEYMSKMFEYANKKGSLDNNGLPAEFSKRCVKKEEFIRGFNFSYDIYKTDKMWLEKLFRIRSLMSYQLKAISKSLSETANDVSAEQRYTVNSYSIQKNKDGETVCGDSLCEINLRNGNYAAVLSDGMGSGETANIQSHDTVEMFKSMLSIGFDISEAIEMVNLSLVIRSERDCFSTVDVLYLDMKNNRLSIAKVGTAPTYIMQEKQVKKYECNTLPVGILKDIQIQNYTIPLSNKTVVVLLSDGVSNTMLKDASEYDWIKDCLENEFAPTPKGISEKIAEEAIKLNGGKITDDMTVHTVILEKNTDNNTM